MGLIDPRDQKAAKAWLDGAPDQSMSKEIMASLASLPIGTGWIYAPRIGVLEKAAFPLVRTFDSGRPRSERRRAGAEAARRRCVARGHVNSLRPRVRSQKVTRRRIRLRSEQSNRNRKAGPSVGTYLSRLELCRPNREGRGRSRHPSSTSADGAKIMTSEGRAETDRPITDTDATFDASRPYLTRDGREIENLQQVWRGFFPGYGHGHWFASGKHVSGIAYLDLVNIADPSAPEHAGESDDGWRTMDSAPTVSRWMPVIRSVERIELPSTRQLIACVRRSRDKRFTEPH